jgi:hypothetical protein
MDTNESAYYAIPRCSMCRHFRLETYPQNTMAVPTGVYLCAIREGARLGSSLVLNPLVDATQTVLPDCVDFHQPTWFEDGLALIARAQAGLSLASPHPQKQ